MVLNFSTKSTNELSYLVWCISKDKKKNAFYHEIMTVNLKEKVKNIHRKIRKNQTGLFTLIRKVHNYNPSLR